MHRMPTPQMRHERSLQDAKTSNDIAKTAAQTTILINGAAATALLAYAANITKGAARLWALPWALGWYAFGVFWGALMTIFLSLAIEQWMIRWFPETDDADVETVDAEALKWWRRSLACFVAGMACFILGSGFVAYGILRP